MKIGDSIFVHGYVDEIRKDCVIIRNRRGYFGTEKCEIIQGDIVRCKDCKWWQDSEVGVVECPICTRIHDMVFEMGADGFCSRGEHREESEVDE